MESWKNVVREWGLEKEIVPGGLCINDFEFKLSKPFGSGKGSRWSAALWFRMPSPGASWSSYLHFRAVSPGLTGW